jgi:hypothetical protein
MSFWPDHNPTLFAMRAVVQDAGIDPADRTWAVRAIVDEDGTAHLRPLYRLEVPAFVEASWDYPEFLPFSMEPDA